MSATTRPFRVLRSPRRGTAAAKRAYDRGFAVGARDRETLDARAVEAMRTAAVQVIAAHDAGVPRHCLLRDDAAYLRGRVAGMAASAVSR